MISIYCHSAITGIYSNWTGYSSGLISFLLIEVSFFVVSNLLSIYIIKNIYTL